MSELFLNKVLVGGKPLLALDADNVIIDSSGAFREFANQRLGTNIQREDITGFNSDHIIYGVTVEVMNRLYVEFDDQIGSRHLLAVDGAIDGCLRLKELFDLAIITARPNKLLQETASWFDLFLPITELVFAAGYHNFLTQKDGRPNKWQKASRLGAIALVDDNPHEFGHADFLGVHPVCFAQPWNLHVCNVPRLDWQTLPDYLIGLIEGERS